MATNRQTQEKKKHVSREEDNMVDSTYDPIYNQEQQMNLLEFFRNYKNDIRQFLIITEGHYGLTIYDDLANDQILRVAAYTKQRRLVAKANTVNGHGGTRYLSIPVNVPYMFKVVLGHHRVEEPAKLCNIINTHSYPIIIQFARRYPEMKVDGSTVSSDSIACLLLLREYEENFLCYHYVDNGVMEERTNLSALSTHISCALITGERNMTNKEFQEHLANMDYQITCTTYDRTSGNPEITRITDNGTGTGNPIPHLDPPLIPQEKVVHRPLLPPPLPARESEQPPIPVDAIMQPEPPRQSRQQQPNVVQPPNSDDYLLPMNENTRLVVSPMPRLQEANTTEYYSEPDMTEDEHLSYAETDGQSEKTREWLDNLSVSGVSDVLRRLRLNKFVEIFQTDLVNGTILRQYDEDLLREEYNFRRVEIIRLMTFVRTGHIPS